MPHALRPLHPLASAVTAAYCRRMVVIRFPDAQTERRALGFLTGRFPGKTWADGNTLVPEEALAHLAMEGIEFIVKGRAKYDREYAPVRDSASAAL